MVDEVSQPKWPFPTGLHQHLFTVPWFKGELRASVTPVKPHHLHQFLVPDSPVASAHALGPHRLGRVPSMAGSITVPTVSVGLWAQRSHRTCTRRGWAWFVSQSSQSPRTQDPSPQCLLHKEQDMPAPLGLFSEPG